MKLKYFLTAIAFVAFTLVSNAQSKVGTVDTDYIVSKMPEFTTVQEQAKTYNADLEKQLQGKVTDYQNKLTAYQKGGFSDVMKKTKEEELIRLEQEINQFKQNGIQLAQLKQQELLRPLYQKITTAISEIAKAENYSQILNLGGVELAYFDQNNDITKKVMAKLGIKE